MVINIISKKVLYKKSVVVVLVFLVLGFGIYLFSSNYALFNKIRLYDVNKYKGEIGGEFIFLKNRMDFAFENNDGVLEGVTAAVLGVDSSNKKQTDATAKSVPALLYHGLIDEPDGANILKKNFKEQMFLLKKAGYQTVTIEDFYKFMKGEKELPAKSFLLTFDDGAKSSYYPVDPILKALNYTAVSFIITKQSVLGEEGVYYLYKDELKRMLKSGRWELQPHTRDGHEGEIIDSQGNTGHYFSNLLWLKDKNRLETQEEFTKRIKQDFINVKEDVEKEFDTKAYSFSFPFGDFGQNTVNFKKAEDIITNTVKEVYPLAFYQGWPNRGFNTNFPDKNGHMVKRVDVEPWWTGEDLLEVLENSQDKELPYKDDLSKDKGWVTNWGSIIIKDGTIIMNPLADTYGGATFLDGTYLWKDYEYKAKIKLLKGESVSLISRYKNDHNYASCDFSKNAIRIRQHLENNITTLFEDLEKFSLPKKNFEIIMRVSGSEIECSLDKKIVAATYNLTEKFPNGGIGFKSWDPKINSNEVIVEEISVIPLGFTEEKSTVRGKPALFDDANISIQENTSIVSFRLADKNKNLLNAPGKFKFVIKDKFGTTLISREVNVRQEDYKIFRLKGSDKKVYEYRTNFSSSELTGAATSQIFAEFMFESKEGTKISATDIKKTIPAKMLNPDIRYQKNAKELNLTMIQGRFQFTILKVGKFAPNIDLKDNISTIRGRRPNPGAPKNREYYRMDIEVKNLGDSAALVFDKAYLQDEYAQIYRIRYESDPQILDGYYPQGISKQGYFIFPRPKKEAEKLAFFYQSSHETNRVYFVFDSLPNIP